ncbi:MAG: class I SAM-dependent methyltransferase [Actinomycetota bacterium]|nr:class I SAM-dependent methyltransferase [Actinomycetota bacterium]
MRRSLTLFRKFRNEQTDPEGFYSFLAEDAVRQVGCHAELRGRLVLDVGGGPGYTAESFRRAGARCFTVDADYGSLFLDGRRPDCAIVGDGSRLPVRDASVDVCYSSNVLEHVPDPWGMLEELVRVVRVGGVVFLSFTNWYSPWGGHETSPWHFLGGERAALRYERRHGHPPKNRYGATLFPVHISQVLRWLRSRSDLELTYAAPRYYPTWCRWVLAIPGLREFATWNPALVVRRTR